MKKNIFICLICFMLFMISVSYLVFDHSVLVSNMEGNVVLDNVSHVEVRAFFFSYLEFEKYIMNEDDKGAKENIDKVINNMIKDKFNLLILHVRPFSDSIYPSLIFPRSKYIGNVSFDVLKYFINKCHDNNIKIHAWINPYRYATAEENYGRLSTDYSTTHPDWLINCGGITILNPGLPAVREQIVKIVVDILEKYDVDGIVFDDYFYQDGMKDEYDDALYAKYNPDSLERGDWRRHQVNLMVQDVYNAIKLRKPWCRFGISPAGVAASNKTVADKYGITPCPSGSDWQYNQIYAEPVQDAAVCRYDRRTVCGIQEKEERESGAFFTWLELFQRRKMKTRSTASSFSPTGTNTSYGT